MLGIPLIGNIIGTAFQRKKSNWIKLTDLSSLPPEQPVKLTFASPMVSAFIHETVLRDVWAISYSPSKIIVYSPICPHLGCEYYWNPQSGQFDCPCHGSVFTKDGKVLAGPSPRSLDTLPAKVENGVLFIEWEAFKIGIPEKIRV